MTLNTRTARILEDVKIDAKIKIAALEDAGVTL